MVQPRNNQALLKDSMWRSKKRSRSNRGRDCTRSRRTREEREPSLLNIKGLLIDIQTSIAKITKENVALRKEVSDLKASLEFNDEELRDIKSSIAKAASAYAALQQRLDATNNELSVATNTLKHQKYKTERLEDLLDTFEQCKRKNSL